MAEQHATDAAAGSIYDIGYQRYDGPRLGRANAVRTLVAHGLRTTFGIGRSERSRFAPLALVALALVPAVIQAWVGAATADMVSMVSYHTYFQQIEFVFLLFCAAQAPELVTTDQQNRVLPLYFSRPLRPPDYAAAKVLALFLAILVIGLAGQLTLLAGRVLGSDVLLDGWRAERWAVVPILVSTAAGALLMAGVSLTIASLMKTRAIASAAVLAFFLVLTALAPLLRGALDDDTARYAVLLSPLISLQGMTHWLFDAEPHRRTMLARAALPGHYYTIAVAVFIIVAGVALFGRYRRVRA